MGDDSDLAHTKLELDPAAAIERWCNQARVRKMRRLKKLGHTGQTLAAILGKETAHDRREDPFCRVLDELREELREQLHSGSLIAAGYVTGDPPGAPRSDVEPNRWSVLRLDFDNWSAEGSGITLNDLRIREPSSGTAATSNAKPDVGVQLSSLTESTVTPRLIIRRRAKVAELDGRNINLPDQPFRLLLILAESARAGTGYVGHPELERTLWLNLQLPASRELRDVVRVLRDRLGASSLDPAEARLLVGNSRSPVSSWGLHLQPDEISITD